MDSVQSGPTGDQLMALMYLCSIVVTGIPAAWATFDAAKKPTNAWLASGQNKTLWILAPFVSLLCCGLPGLLVPIFYLFGVRPKVVAEMAPEDEAENLD